MEFYTYIYLDPRRPGAWTVDSCGISFLFEPFYVGKGKGKRIFSHLTSKQNDLKLKKIARIRSEGYQPVLLKVKENCSESDALKLEEEMITEIGTRWVIRDVKRGPLTNMTSGGEGRSLCDETKKKLSQMNKGEGNPMFGKKRTEREKQMLREYRKTFRHTVETRTHLSKKRSNGNNSNSKRWIIVHVDGRHERVFHLKGWCAEHSVSYNTLFNTRKKGTPISRGSGKGLLLIEDC